MMPEFESAVLGGNFVLPQPGSAVLGGHGKILGKLFEEFNSEAKLCNGNYFRLELSERLALVRKRKASPHDDIKIKYFVIEQLSATFQEMPILAKYWAFAGFLKHEGLLFGSEARYEPAGCYRDIRPTVLSDLLWRRKP